MNIFHLPQSDAVAIVHANANDKDVKGRIQNWMEYQPFRKDRRDSVY